MFNPTAVVAARLRRSPGRDLSSVFRGPQGRLCRLHQRLRPHDAGAVGEFRRALSQCRAHDDGHAGGAADHPRPARHPLDPARGLAALHRGPSDPRHRYSRNILPGDTANAVVINAAGDTICPPRGASDAYLAPYHVERGKLYAQTRFGQSTLIDSERIIASIDFTRFPGPARAALRRYRGRTRSGARGRPDRPARRSVLPPQDRGSLSRVQRNRHGQKLGYNTPMDLMEQFPNFFWSQVQPLIGPALRHLEQTMEGKQWWPSSTTTSSRSRPGPACSAPLQAPVEGAADTAHSACLCGGAGHDALASPGSARAICGILPGSASVSIHWRPHLVFNPHPVTVGGRGGRPAALGRFGDGPGQTQHPVHRVRRHRLRRSWSYGGGEAAASPRRRSTRWRKRG